ncbi:FtsX-like permease family protein [Paludicola sp. MB14-C6]|uniref:FtsX-like permease family protein n=1 Tax=Paludihabitans sp. MB14-C6 TaxID=3070656 RepID=UPI0027DDDDCB|nr:FtsX-like permease family protein [Paludicola sp. MB14-C6]WMJ23845.1 FtsX-like permease family protein [Paludicola sp. MB14-C6]
MFFKLALNNVKKSIKDYSIYFLTLTFGICIFYVFNSIESQDAMLMLNSSQKEIIHIMSQVIGYVSVFISVILGFLILFANKFLIKRRKKELGLYMTLGMEKGKISRVLILETLIIGVVSLVVGLVAGFFISQGLSVITAHLFEVDMKAFTFVFSQSAFLKSIVYFGLIYFIVMIFNTIAISKYKLIDLLTAGKKNESLKVKNIWVSVILFILSVICLAIGYTCIIKNGMMQINYVFWMAIIFGSIGTFLFFMSLSGFLLKIVQSNKKLYFKNLNMFVLRQLNSKINTTFISMTVICLMLLIAIGTLSSGMGLNDALTKDLEDITPFDITIEKSSFDLEKGQQAEKTQKESIASFLQKHNVDFNQYVKDYTEFSYYATELTMGDIIPPKIPGISEDMLKAVSKMPAPVVALSEYNAVMKMQGKPTIKLQKNQFAINCNSSANREYVQEFIDNNGMIEIGGQKLIALNKELLKNTIVTTAMKMDTGTVIISDELLKNCSTYYSALNVNLKNSDDIDAFAKEIDKVYKGSNIPKDISYISKTKVYEQNVGLSAVLTYLTIYIGIIFLITSAAVLALQQLSEAADNAQRYTLLRKLGAEPKMINKALFSQIFIYFMMPLLLAIVHSVVGIKVANNLVKTFGDFDILGNTVMIAAIIILIYGGYFVATYFSSKNIIRPRKS